MEDIHPLTAFRKSQTPPLSKAGLAKLLGLSRSYIRRLETRERKPGLELLPQISAKTGIPTRELRPDWAEKMEAAE